MDANEDVTAENKPMAQLLTEPQMKDLIAECHPRPRGTPTFHRGDRHGSKQMDAVVATPETHATAGRWLSTHQSPGDHLVAMADVKWRVLLGEDMLKTVCPVARRLTGRLPATQCK